MSIPEEDIKVSLGQVRYGGMSSQKNYLPDELEYDQGESYEHVKREKDKKVKTYQEMQEEAKIKEAAQRKAEFKFFSTSSVKPVPNRKPEVLTSGNEEFGAGTVYIDQEYLCAALREKIVNAPEDLAMWVEDWDGDFQLRLESREFKGPGHLNLQLKRLPGGFYELQRDRR